MGILLSILNLFSDNDRENVIFYMNGKFDK